MHAPARSELNAAFSQYKDLLQAVALRLCGNAPDAYDLVQDTFERALRAGQPRSVHNLRGWLLTILRNLFVDRCRSRQRQPMIFSIDLHHDFPNPTPDYEPEWLDIPSEQVEKALSGLDERFRTVFELHCVHEVSYEEIAKTLNIPKNTVGTRLSRARSKITKYLSQNRSEQAEGKAGRAPERSVRMVREHRSAGPTPPSARAVGFEIGTKELHAKLRDTDTRDRAQPAMHYRAAA